MREAIECEWVDPLAPLPWRVDHVVNDGGWTVTAAAPPLPAGCAANGERRVVVAVCGFDFGSQATAHEIIRRREAQP